MRTVEDAMFKLIKLEKRYNKFKQFFNEFQKNIDELAEGKFSLKGIIIDHKSDTVSRIQFLGSNFRIAFFFVLVDGASKGKLTFSKINPFDDKDFTEINSVLYNGDGYMDIKPPNGEDPLNVLDGYCSRNVVLDFLCEELEKNEQGK